MAYCNQAGITDAAFAHLKDLKVIHAPSMPVCSQVGITDAAFVRRKRRLPVKVATGGGGVGGPLGGGRAARNPGESEISS